jgi:hypothetical protein
MLAGLLLELMGYTARIFMHNDPSSREAFLLLVHLNWRVLRKLTQHHRDNITLILGPAFLAASIYLCMGHLVRIYGENLSPIKVRFHRISSRTLDLADYQTAADVSFDLCSL